MLGVEEVKNENVIKPEEIPGKRAKEEFKNFLEEVDIRNLFNTKVKGKFLLIKYTHDKNREDEFLKFLFFNIAIYALSKEERECLSPKDADQILRLSNIAVSRFVTNSKTGEFGEIILFHLLELFEGAIQIVNKMTLKTAGGMYVHGADAIHFGFHDDLKVLYLGESKTGASFSETLKKSLTDTDNYHKEGKREFDINLAAGNISEDITKEHRELIKKYLNPTTSDLSDFTEIQAIFLGFQNNTLNTLEENHNGKLLEKVIESYKREIESYITDIESKFEEFPDLKDKRFLFFVIPFKDLSGLREKFGKAIENAKKVTI